MARPRKDSNTPSAEERIYEAFWRLLETHRLQELSVSRIAAEAGCHRATFYYHFTDLSQLVDCAVKEETLGRSNLPYAVFRANTGFDENVFSAEEYQVSVKRIQLLARQGGMFELRQAIASTCMEIWNAVLCPNGEPLKRDTRYALEYAMNGVIGMLLSCKPDERGMLEQPSPGLVKDVSSFMMGRVCQAQGVEVRDILNRLALYDRMHIAQIGRRERSR